MLSLGKPQVQQLGPYQMSLAQIQQGSWTDLPLGNLKRNNNAGIGVLLAVEVSLQMVIVAGSSDPAVPWYMVHRLVDLQLIGADNFTFRDEKGWHRPVREVFQNGRFVGAITADYPASTAAGTRNLTARIDFVEPRMADPLWRCLPVAAFRGGKLRIFAWTTNQNVNGTSTFKLSDLIVTAYFKVQDMDPAYTPIGSFVEEKYLAGQIDVEPSPGLGKYLRCANWIDPATASIKDDLAAITKVTFGSQGPTGYTMRDQSVAQLMRRFADEYATEPKRDGLGTLTTPPTDAIGFLNPVSNNTGRLHAIPLVLPGKKDTMIDMPDWSDAPPLMKINDDNRGGTPASLDFMTDRIVERTDQQVAYILEAVAPGKGLASRYQGAAAHSKYRNVAGVNHRKAPLVMNLR